MLGNSQLVNRSPSITQLVRRWSLPAVFVIHWFCVIIRKQDLMNRLFNCFSIRKWNMQECLTSFALKWVFGSWRNIRLLRPCLKMEKWVPVMTRKGTCFLWLKSSFFSYVFFCFCTFRKQYFPVRESEMSLDWFTNIFRFRYFFPVRLNGETFSSV